jgi:hypothetical protein
MNTESIGQAFCPFLIPDNFLVSLQRYGPFHEFVPLKMVETTSAQSGNRNFRLHVYINPNVTPER